MSVHMTMFWKVREGKGYGPRRYLSSRGMLLADILIALALAASFVAAVSYASTSSQDTFRLAREKERLIEVYRRVADDYRDLMPGEVRERIVEGDDGGGDAYARDSSDLTYIRAAARWYGNERIQTDVTVSTMPIAGSLSSDRLYGRWGRGISVKFSIVRPTPQSLGSDESSWHVATPLCTADFMRRSQLGYPEFGSKRDISRSNLQIRPIVLPIGQVPLTHLEVRDGIAYVSADSSVAGDPDLMIFDIRGQQAQMLSAIDTGPGISDFALAGNLLYAAAASTAFQLHVVRIDNLESMSLVSKYRIPLPYATATPPMASAIAYDHGVVYLGTEKWQSDELWAISFEGSDVVAPYVISSLEVGSKVNDIYVRNRMAYVAASAESQMVIIDASHPSSLSWGESFAFSGWERQEGRVAAGFEDEHILGRTAGGFNIVRDHEVYRWKMDAAATDLGGIDMSADVSGGVYSVVPDRSWIFLATGKNGGQFEVMDRDGMIALEVALTALPRDMTCDLDRMYILSRDAPVIYEVRHVE